MSMKRIAVVVLSLLPFLVVAYHSNAPAWADGAPVLRVICLPARPLALTVALEKGLLAKHGIQVAVQVAANSDELRTALANGTADLAHAAVDNAVALAEKTHLDIAIVMGGEGSTNELIAQPGITSIESLRGRTVIVDAPTTAYAIQLKKILLLHGLQAGRDYDIKPVGSTPLRLAAMCEHKEYAASILGPPTSLLAKQKGFVSLGTTQQFLGAYQGVGAFLRRPWAKENREPLVAYITAFIEAQRWILAPENKSQVIALLAREFKLSQPLATQAYDSWIVAPSGFEPDAQLNMGGFNNVLKLRAEIEHTWEGAPPSPETYYDPEYSEAAIAKTSRPATN